MDDVERLSPLRRVDDAYETALRTPSSDRRDGDVMPAERADECAGDVGLSFRTGADESDDRLIALPGEDRGTIPELDSEFTANRPYRGVSLAAVHHHRHRARRRSGGGQNQLH